MSATVTVVCGRCRQTMRYAEALAYVSWIDSNGNRTEQTYLRFECDTPDCGNVVQVEAS
jgi:hypothetical protein